MSMRLPGREILYSDGRLRSQEFESLLFGTRTLNGSLCASVLASAVGGAAPDSAKVLTLLCDLGQVSHPLWALSFLNLYNEGFGP